PDTGTLNLKESTTEADISPNSPMHSEPMVTFAHLPSVKCESLSGSVLKSLAKELSKSPRNTDLASVKLDEEEASKQARCHCSKFSSLLNTFPISNIFWGYVSWILRERFSINEGSNELRR